MKKLFFLLFVFLFCAHTAFASAYVLPYPSTMPGGISYKLHLVWEKILQYWYFGDFGQFTYNLKESDKYLVEAKTLFEYQQYLLGFNALQKSNRYFFQTMPFLLQAKSHGKDISENRALLHDAAEKHIEVLTQMEQETPASFTWTPEKSSSSQLNITGLIRNAIVIRQKYL